MKKHEASEIADLVSVQITNILSPKIAEHIVAAIVPQVAKILSTTDHLKTTLKEAKGL